jgi:hypothetical protein
MTWNPFARRKLARSGSTPVSPNTETRRRWREPPKQFRVVVEWDFNKVVSGHTTTFPERMSSVPYVSPLLFVLPVTSLQLDPGELRVVWESLTAFLDVQLWMNYGGGLASVAVAHDLAYPGGQPYESGAITWDVGGGLVRVSVSGNKNV